MDVTGIISLVAAGGIWGASLFAERKGGRSSICAVRVGRWAIFISAVAIVGMLLYLSREQFLAWQGSEFGKYFLPPYQSIRYFLGYVAHRIWASYAVSAAMAVIAYGACLWANRVRGNMLFECEEIGFVVVGIFLTGHPGYVAYLMLVAVAYGTVSIGRFVITHKNERISFYRFWLPCAVIIIMGRLYLAQYGWYTDLLI